MRRGYWSRRRVGFKRIPSEDGKIACFSLFSFPVAHAFQSCLSRPFLERHINSGEELFTGTDVRQLLLQSGSTRSVAVGGTISRATTGLEFNKMHCAKCRGCARQVDLFSSPSTLHDVSWPNLGVDDMGGIQVCRQMKSDPGRIPERGGCWLGHRAGIDTSYEMRNSLRCIGLCNC